MNFLKSHRSLLVSLLIISTFQLVSGCKWFRKYRPGSGQQQDSGMTLDAGTQSDGSVPDAGDTDAGDTDAGDTDATMPDAGNTDGSMPGDAQVPTNTAPIAQTDSFTVPQYDTLTVAAPQGLLANDNDVDGDPLTAELVTGPSVGSVDIYSNGGFAFSDDGEAVVDAGNPSTDVTFTYRAFDGLDYSADTTVTITVTHVPNQPPVAVDDGVNADEDNVANFAAAVGVGANDSDPDVGDSLTFALDTPPAKGLVTLNADGSFAFDPNSQFDSLDAGDAESVSFIYTVTDREGAAAQATVTVQVTGLNDATAVQAVAAATPGNTLLTTTSGPLLAAASDVDADAVLSVVADTLTTAGGASVSITTAGNFSYRPAVGAAATTDSFDFSVSDDQNVITVGTATITLGDEIIWYVDNGVGSSGDGRSDAPFATIAEAEAASGPGDVFYVHTGSTAYTGVALASAQRFIGAGAALGTTIGGNPFGVLPAGTAPTLTGSGVGVTLADGNEVAGITVAVSGDAGISGTGITGTAISQVLIDQPATRGLHLDGVSGTVELTSVTVQATGTEALLIENSSADVEAQNLVIAGAFTTDVGNDVGLYPEQAIGSAVRLLSNTGPFTWNGGSLHCGDGRLPGMYAEDVGAISLAGAIDAPLEVSHCGTAVASGKPVTGIYVTNATSFNGQFLALHDLAPGIGLSDSAALGAVHLIDVSNAITFEDSTIGVSEASWGIVANPAWDITLGHGLYIESTAATSALDVAFNNNRCEGPAGSVINLRDCFHMDFNGDDNARVDLTANDNVGNYVFRMYQILLRGTTGTAARNTFHVDNNVVNGIQKDGIKFRVYDSPEAMLEFTNNHLSGEPAAAVDNGILVKQYGTIGTPELDITVANSTIDTFAQGAVTVEFKKVGAVARVLIDGNRTSNIGNIIPRAHLRLLAAGATSIDATLTNNTIVNPDLVEASMHLATTADSHICLDARDNTSEPEGSLYFLWFDNSVQSATTGISVTQVDNAELASDNDDIDFTFSAGGALNYDATCLLPN